MREMPSQLTILVDFRDSLADELSLSFDRIYLELIYRDLYYFSIAYDKGEADNLIKYFPPKKINI